MSGRRAEAERNDGRILAAARAVFVADPGSPISAVAEHAGVGISALYRRYPSKEDLLHTLCAEGLRTYLEAVEAAVEDRGDGWRAFARFLERVVDADTHSLTQRLAGSFTPTAELARIRERGLELSRRLVDRTIAAGALRPDFDVADLPFILEQLSAVRLGDERRTRQLRRRYLTLFLQALRPGPAPLPGPAPTGQEIARRWSL